MALFLTFPLFELIYSWTQPDLETLNHLKEYLALRLSKNTFLLLAGVLPLTAILGFTLALASFNLSKKYRVVFDFVSILPLAFPTYVFASTFQGLYGPDGTLFYSQWSSLTLSILCLSLAFYPYVFLFVKTGLSRLPESYFLQSKLMGISDFKILKQIVFPLTLPWLSAGLLVVAMECLAEFGALALLSLDTLTTAIYKTWFSFYSLNGATQLASILLIPAIALTLFDRLTRKKLTVELKGTPLKHWQAKSFKHLYLTLLPISLVAVFFPLFQLLHWIYRRSFLTDGMNNSQESLLFKDSLALLPSIKDSLVLALVAGIVAVLLGLLLSYSRSFFQSKRISLLKNISSLGYAMPGTLLAVVFFISWMRIDTAFADFRESLGQQDTDLILSSLGVITLLALVFRFLAGPIHSIDNAIKQGMKNQILCARTLGVSPIKILFQVVLPQLRGPIGLAYLLVVIEVLKELPIVLMTRSLDANYLSVQIYQFTSEGDWLKAALPSFWLVMVGMAGVALIRKGNDRG